MQPLNGGVLEATMGKKFSDPCARRHQGILIPGEDKKTDNIIVTVEYMGKRRIFAGTVVGDDFGDLKIRLDEGIKITDCVLSVRFSTTCKARHD